MWQVRTCLVNSQRRTAETDVELADVRAADETGGRQAALCSERPIRCEWTVVSFLAAIRKTRNSEIN